ncbi:MAG: hypothetical protein ABL908_11430 [Hyphomicrobium sp.]
MKDVRESQYHTHRRILFIDNQLKSHRAPAHAMQEDVDNIQFKLRDIETELDRVRHRLGLIDPSH